MCAIVFTVSALATILEQSNDFKINGSCWDHYYKWNVHAFALIKYHSFPTIKFDNLNASKIITKYLKIKECKYLYKLFNSLSDVVIDDILLNVTFQRNV